MSGDADSLPLAHVKRIVRSKLAELSGSVAEGGKKKEVSVQKEALTAFAEAAKIFIHYLTGTANELCHEGKRLTVNAEDVLRALEEVEFAEFAGPLREALAGARTEGGKRCGAEPGSYAPPPPPRTAQDSRRRLRRRLPARLPARSARRRETQSRVLRASRRAPHRRRALGRARRRRSRRRRNRNARRLHAERRMCSLGR
jgi:DNA polymerase epsilon subunit 3